MFYGTPPPRNPRYLSIPTLLTALVSAHVLHMACEPLELGSIACTVAYLAGLAVPIILKRAFTPRTYDETDDFGFDNVPRLPTSRFSTTPGENTSADSGHPLTY